MWNPKTDLGAQSFCYRGFPEPKDLIAKLKETGLTKTEVCRRHVNFDDESVFEGVIELFKNEGVEILSIGVERITDDEAAAEKKFKFCRMAGCRYMSVDFPLNATPGSYRVAERLADKYDVNLAIHNHGGHHWIGTAGALEHIFGQTSPRIGLSLDTAWAIDARQDPIAMAEQFADRLYGVHIKDFTWRGGPKGIDVIAGTGNLDLPGFLATLQKIGFDGYGVLEYEADVDNPVPAMKECVEAVHKAAN